MSIAIQPRPRVNLHGGGPAAMSPADRATLARLLLERGLEVSFGSSGGAAESAGPDGVGATLELQVNTAHTDGPSALAESIVREAAIANGTPATWKPWFPVIDYSRCTNCMQCLSFCLFDVYGVSTEQKIQVQNQNNCKTDCPACSRVCPEVAIMFPKYRHGPINGEEVTVDDVRREAMKVDISALLGGDIYSLLRDRSAKAQSRFSKERDDERALKERQNCLIALKQDLDIPAEVLAALPSAEEIVAKADAARRRAEAARAASPGPQERS
jgi:Pyruvate/2-oxoacid:ferredoxin oxidoreductase delta subunit